MGIALSTHAQQVSVSNNLLYDAWITPNLRLGVQVAPQWSVGLTAGYRPWPSDDATTRKWRHLLLSPDVRFWTDSVNVHHFFGANLIYSHYNVADVTFPFGLYKGVRNERRQGDLAALGVFYGYSWPLGRFWNLEALVGVAVGYTKFKRYECTHCGKKLDDESKPVAIPQAALNVVYNIPGRPRRTEMVPVEENEVVEEQMPMPVVEAEPFVPMLSNVPDFTGRAGLLQHDNPVLQHVSQYRPYDRTQVLRRDKEALYVHFPVGVSVLHPEFRENAPVLRRIVDIARQIMADSTSSVKTIQIVGLASIEGSIDGNERLAKNRALALQRYIQEQITAADSLFDTTGGGEAWAEFRNQLEEEMAATSPYDGQLKQALDVIDNVQDLNERERQLKRMNGGRTWAYLKEHILKDQRNSGYMRIYYDYVPDTAAAIINRASELLRTDCGDCHRQALSLLQQVSGDKRAQNALGVALYLCGRENEALDRFRRAAAQGNADAQENLRQIERD